jgi:hypothetical protein
VEQFIHRQNLGRYSRLRAAPDQKSLSWRVVTRGFDENRAGARGGVAPGVGSYVVDGVGRHLRGIDKDVAHERAVQESYWDMSALNCSRVGGDESHSCHKYPLGVLNRIYCGAIDWFQNGVASRGRMFAIAV